MEKMNLKEKKRTRELRIPHANQIIAILATVGIRSGFATAPMEFCLDDRNMLRLKTGYEDDTVIATERNLHKLISLPLIMRDLLVDLKNYVTDAQLLPLQYFGAKIPEDRRRNVFRLDENVYRAICHSLRDHPTIQAFWTDYPILAFGDQPGVEAPVRRCDPLAYDRNKYVLIDIDGHQETIKSGYVYQAKGRCGEVHTISATMLGELPIE